MSNQPAIFHQRRNGYLVSTNPNQLDFGAIHSFLSENTSWREGITLDELRTDLLDSLCFGLFEGEKQIGFASVTTDFSSFAYLTDVFVLEKYRGKGLAKWLLETVLSHPDLQGKIDWMLSSEDAQGLYEQMGFSRTNVDGEQMEKLS
jgi:GNAT superfamily N-acetyltransferase